MSATNFTTTSITTSELTVNGNATTTGTLNVGNSQANGKISINGKVSIRDYANNGWLGINDTLAWTNGVYFGKSTVRTDGTFQVGDSGSRVLFNTSSAKFTVPVTINNSLAANNITATNVTVNDTLKAYKYELSTIQDLGGEFCVSPTIFIQSGATVNVSKASATTITVSIKDTKSITSDTIQGIRWSTSSKIKFQGKIDGVAIRCNGIMASKLNTDANTMALTLTVDSGIADHFATTVNGASYSDISVMLYQRYGKKIGSTTDSVYSPVGIRMSAIGNANSAPYVDIWGSKSNSDPDTIYTIPSVRLGYLDGLKCGTYDCVGYGLYADNVYLNGTIVSNSGTIGGFNITTNALSNGAWGTDKSVLMCTGTDTAKSVGGSSAISGWCFTAGSKFGVTTNGDLYASNANISGTINASKGTIGGFNITDNSLYTGSKSSFDNEQYGIFMDKDGQVIFGNSDNYLKYYKNDNQNFKIDIRTDLLSFTDSSIRLGEYYKSQIIDDLSQFQSNYVIISPNQFRIRAIYAQINRDSLQQGHTQYDLDYADLLNFSTTYKESKDVNTTIDGKTYFYNLNIPRINVALGVYSSASGGDSFATGSSAAYGESSTAVSHGIARAQSSFADTEGDACAASSHASTGGKTTACNSTAMGRNSVASGEEQVVIGCGNIINDKLSFIIGNGRSTLYYSTDDEINTRRSNAFTVDWDGNTWAAGSITATGSVKGTDFNGFTINKSVPSDAKFTDTVTVIENSCDSDSTTSALSAAQGKSLKTYIDSVNTNAWNSLQESYRNNYGKQYNTQVPLLINGNSLGLATAQLILEYNNSYIRFRNDGSSFYIMNGNASSWTNYITFQSTGGVVVPNTLKVPTCLYVPYATKATTTSAANAYISADGNGVLAKTSKTSSRRFKDDITTDLDDDLNPQSLYDVDVVQFKYKKDYFTNEEDIRYRKNLIGFIAEDVYDKYKIAADWHVDDETGEVLVDAWNEQYIVPAMLKLIQEQHKEIEKLKKIIGGE